MRLRAKAATLCLVLTLSGLSSCTLAGAAIGAGGGTVMTKATVDQVLPGAIFGGVLGAVIGYAFDMSRKKKSASSGGKKGYFPSKMPRTSPTRTGLRVGQIGTCHAVQR